MRRRSYRNESKPRTIIGWSLLFVILATLWWFVFPPQLGGRTLLLTTRGTSMEPLLHDGDLAVLRKQPQYKIGDIVEYHSGALNAPLLHRIIAEDQATHSYTTRGDNNGFDDLDHPTNKQINGKMVHMYAGLGNKVHILKSLPVRILGATLVGLAAYYAFRGNDDVRRERRRQRFGFRKRPTVIRGSSQPIQTATSERLSENFELVETEGQSFFVSTATFVRQLLSPGGGLFVMSALLTALGIITATVGFTHSAKPTAGGLYLYTLRGEFNYSGNATGGDLVYRDGQVQTGDPIYPSMVSNLFLTFDTKMETISNYKPSDGSIEFNAELKGSSGWTHPLQLTAPQTFDGSTGRITANLDLNQIKNMISQIAALTRNNESQYSIVLEPVVRYKGTLGGKPFDQTFKPQESFGTSGGTLKAATSSPSASGGPKALNASADQLTGLSVSQGGQVEAAAGAPQQLRTFGKAVGVVTLRTFSIVALILGLLGLAVSYLRHRRNRVVDSKEGGPLDTLTRNPDLFVSVAGWGQASGGSMIIDLPSLDDLARIAESHGCLILHEKSNNVDVFVVNHRHLTYRFKADPVVQAERRFGAEPVTEQNFVGAEGETDAS